MQNASACKLSAAEGQHVAAGDEVADLSAELLAEIAESAPSAVGRRSGKLRLPVGAGCIGKYKKSIRAAPHVVTVLKGNGREG